MVLQTVLIIILEELELIHDTTPIEKLLSVIILIKSVVNNKKNYCYNIFLEKGSHIDKVNTEYFEMSYCIL